MLNKHVSRQCQATLCVPPNTLIWHSRVLVILVCLPLEVIIQLCASLLGHDEHNDTTVEKVDFARESALNQQPSTSGDSEVPHSVLLLSLFLKSLKSAQTFFFKYEIHIIDIL